MEMYEAAAKKCVGVSDGGFWRTESGKGTGLEE